MPREIKDCGTALMLAFNRVGGYAVCPDMCSGSRSLDLQQMVEQRGHLIKTQTHTHRRTTTKSCAGESDGLWCTSEWIKQITLKAEQFILMKTLSYNSAAITQRFAHSASGHNHGVWFWREDVSISTERCVNACQWSVTRNKVKYDHKTWCCVWYTFFLKSCLWCAWFLSWGKTGLSDRMKWCEVCLLWILT